MALDAGTRLGPYEVLAPIGKGGMGEVYRARDTKLERDVAIKVLPEELAKGAVHTASRRRLPAPLLLPRLHLQVTATRIAALPTAYGHLSVNPRVTRFHLGFPTPAVWSRFLQKTVN